MSRNPKALVDGTTLTTSTVALYTAGTGVTAVIKNAVAVNRTAGGVVVDLHLVPSGGSASDDNKIAVSVGADETLTLPEIVSMTLEPGDALHAKADTGTAIALMVSGVEIS